MTTTNKGQFLSNITVVLFVRHIGLFEAIFYFVLVDVGCFLLFVVIVIVIVIVVVIVIVIVIVMVLFV